MQQENSNSILKAESLRIGYRSKQETHIISSDINFEINKGELVAVIGVNGVGKSTLLRSLSGVQEPLSGKVKIMGTELSKISSIEQASLISLVLTSQPIRSEERRVGKECER